MNEPKLDQHEANAKRDVLDLKGRYLRADLENKTGERIAAPELSRDDVLADIITLESHVASLEAKLNLAPRQPVTQTSKIPALKGVGADISKATKAAAKPQTSLDAKILAREGVSSVQELAAKRAEQRYGAARRRIESDRKTK